MSLNRVSRADDRVRVRNVLVSVSDKTGLAVLVAGLISVNPEIKFYSTGGTYAHLESLLGDQAKIHLKSVSEYTGQPEMQGGLVKTLDFKIYMGLLSETYNDAHRLDLKRTASVEFDLVVVNLYRFEDTVAQPGVTLEDARTHIDIGGPCMLRASAKNFLRVASVCDPDDYPLLLDELKKNEATTGLVTRLAFAKKTFAHTAAYDTTIAHFLTNHTGSLEGLYQRGGL
jgi:phosphoribosylaminoimidazolecarboxamide formyltransferase / IMP cyclohydrolase